MNKPPKRPESPKKSPPSTAIQKSAGVKTDISPDQEMIQTIRQLKNGLQDYEIRQLVTQAEKLGNHLVDQGLKTNQIRKFLDAVNRLKVKLSQDETQQFKTIEDEVILLKPKLAYAAARQQSRHKSPVQPLADVIAVAIDHVYDTSDFYRLVQLIESIIAYHKAAGGRDN